MRPREAAVQLHRALLCRRRFFRLNQMLFELGLHGIGVLNYENSRVSGELNIIQRLARFELAPTILDIGAHTGEYSQLVKTVIPDAQIFAFEPHPDTFARLAAGAVSGVYTPVHAAVTNRHGTAVLYDRRSERGSKHASIVPQVIEEIHRDPHVQSWTVPCLRLDDFLQEQDLRHVHLLKIDAEGAELDILEGARSALDAKLVDLVQVEFNEMNVFSRVFMHDFHTMLPGYSAYRLLPDGPVTLDPYVPVRHEIFGYQNILFVSRSLSNDVLRVLTA